MAGLDLSGVRAVINDWIVDDVLVTRDNAAVDDVLDETSGLLIGEAGREIYHGAGAVQPVSQGTDVQGLNVATAPQDSNTTHRLLLPLEPFDLPPGDRVKFRIGDRVEVDGVVAVTSDPALLGRRFYITEVPDASSFSVLRIVFLKPEYVPEP